MTDYFVIDTHVHTYKTPEIGTDRVLFGTDYPWFNPAWDLKRFLSLGFSDDEKKAILGENARRILKM